MHQQYKNMYQSTSKQSQPLTTHVNPYPKPAIQQVAPLTAPLLANQYNNNNNSEYSRPNNTSIKNTNIPSLQSKPIYPGPPQFPGGIATNPNQFLDKVSAKIYDHFKQKYPTTIDVSGFNKNTITAIVTQSMTKEKLTEKSIAKIIDIIDHKFKMTINSDNRQGKQYDTTTFSMDEESKISIDKYLENYTNKIAILVNSDKAIEAELPKNMSPANDMIKIGPPEPFTEDFPIRDREKQTDMMIPEIREFDYYIAINSNDRDMDKYPNPNEFIIEFAPAGPASSTDVRRGYIDHSFNNIKSCEMMNVIIYSKGTDSSFTNASYPYLLLQLDELQQNFHGTNNILSKTFAILTDYTTNSTTDDTYRYYRQSGDSSENTVIKIYNPRIKLSKLTVRLLLPNGTPFNFGTIDDEPNISCISLVLRITTIQNNLATQFLNKGMR